jgi:hypothetical protein
MKTVEEYKTVEALLADESRWCRFSDAITCEGIGVPTHDKNATSWCLVGAIRKIYGKESSKIIHQMQDLVRNKSSYHSVQRYNDSFGRTHKEVLDLVKEAGV